MSNYIYTETNNAISKSKLIQGPVGPTGSAGPTGAAGIQGIAGIQGPVGPDNVRKTDVQFNDRINSAFFAVPAYSRWTLVGHAIANNIQDITSVKVIAGASTGNVNTTIGFALADMTTTNSLRRDLATARVEMRGEGKVKDMQIINLDLTNANWPAGNTLLSLWAYIEPPTLNASSKLQSSQKSIFETIALEYGEERASLEKQRLADKLEFTTENILDVLENDYGSTLAGDTEFQKQALRLSKAQKDAKFDSKLQNLLDNEKNITKVNSGDKSYREQPKEINTDFAELSLPRKIVFDAPDNEVLKNTENNGVVVTAPTGSTQAVWGSPLATLNVAYLEWS